MLVAACRIFGLSFSMWDLVSWPEARPPALRAHSLNPWTAREVPQTHLKCHLVYVSLLVNLKASHHTQSKSQSLYNGPNWVFHNISDFSSFYYLLKLLSLSHTGLLPYLSSFSSVIPCIYLFVYLLSSPLECKFCNGKDFVLWLYP